MAEEDPTLIYDFTVATVIDVNIFGFGMQGIVGFIILIILYNNFNSNINKY